MASIFFVDDDLASELLVENLNQRGHDAKRLASADEALQVIDRIADADLVVLDLIMPRLLDAYPRSTDSGRSGGMAVFRELRRRRSDLPILVFTANQDPAIIDIIRDDPHAKYVSRWSAPKFREFIAILHQMLGIEAPVAISRPFIVHGHDDATKLEVKNYLQNTLGLPEPIILHEQPNQGRTLIEKFEDLSSSADLVFVLPESGVKMPFGSLLKTWEFRDRCQDMVSYWFDLRGFVEPEDGSIVRPHQ